MLFLQATAFHTFTEGKQTQIHDKRTLVVDGFDDKTKIASVLLKSCVSDINISKRLFYNLRFWAETIQNVSIYHFSPTSNFTGLLFKKKCFIQWETWIIQNSEDKFTSEIVTPTILTVKLKAFELVLLLPIWYYRNNCWKPQSINCRFHIVSIFN